MWLQGGDQNSAYFHVVIKGRRAYNRLTTIEDELGVPFHEEKEIRKVFADYYSKLFTSNRTHDLGAAKDAISKRVTPEINQALTAIPSDLEILTATMNIHSDKAPGPDGFLVGFYQSFWDVIGVDICREVRIFFEDGKMDKRINETHIFLLPKILGPKRPSEFRPIALCSVRYKIIAKILTLRLQKFLDSIVSEYQSAFIPGRAITDNILITHETLHYLKVSEATKRCSMVVKTDMSKTYDHIEWAFLEEVLQQLGFDPVWINWIMECVTRILQRYEAYSGQCINLNKSTITFSSKTPEAISTRVKSLVSIERAGGMDKYLGLPETFGRCKRDVFTSLVDKIRQR